MWWLPRRFCPPLVRMAGRSTVRAGLLTASVQVGGLLAFSSVTYLIAEYLTGAVPVWLVAILFTLVGMVYTPLIGMAFPDRSGPAYAELRRHLREAGATVGQERAFAWVGGPFTFLGMAVVLPGSLLVFGLL